MGKGKVSISEQLATKASKELFLKIQKELERNKQALYDLVPNEDKKKLFDAVYERSKTEIKLAGSNRGRYYELFFGIILGELKTVDDILNANVTENIPHTEQGDIVVNGRLHYQSKSGGATINIYNRKDLVMNGDKVDEKASLKKIMATYHAKGNKGRPWRYALPIGTNTYGAMLDIGQETMMQYIKSDQGNFDFAKVYGKPTPSFLSCLQSAEITSREDQIAFLEKALREIKSNKKEFLVLVDLANSKRVTRTFNSKVIEETIERLHSYKWGLSFRATDDFAEKMISKYGAVVRTTIGPKEDHTPFHRLLFRYGIKRTGTYPFRSGNYMKKGGWFSKTRPNKEAQNYYDQIYVGDSIKY